MEKFSFLSNTEISVVEDLYQKFKENPENVDFGWKKFFEGYEFSITNYKKSSSQQKTENAITNIDYSTEFKVVNLILAYRLRGHLFTKTNPVRKRRQYSPTLDIENFGLSNDDLQKKFDAGNLIGTGNDTLQNIINHLQNTYCRSIGVEFTFIRVPEIVEWLRSRMESNQNTPDFDKEQKLRILDSLNKAVVFEEFLHTKFVGQKTFSLQGGEPLIPALDAVIQKGSELGIEEFVIGMAHRGRLNVLSNILNKPMEEILSEFQDLEYDDPDLLGDVKYHLGYSNNIKTNSGKEVHITISANPSHLEAVNPIAEGISRAKIDINYKGDNSKLAPILIHGDASIAGQGIVYEVLQYSQLDGYKTGGTIHIVINNQLGFTTNYLEARSSTYCTDVGKVLNVPIFHVNGDDTEALVYTIQLAMEFRQKFRKDIFIDLLGYRKFGHNEADEPRFTQPVLYKNIEKHANARDIYIDELIQQNVIDRDYANNIIKNYKSILNEKLENAKQIKSTKIKSFIRKGKIKETPHCNTSIDKDILEKVSKALTELPSDIKFFDKILKIIQSRKDMLAKGESLDWAVCELLAYGSLVYEGYPVRISGQDSIRGTFSHRHAALYIEDSEELYIPLKHVSENQAKFNIYNSPLSEYGVLGFEYGYALSAPNHLNIWEAQYGDFTNTAQVIIDQYIVSAEEKWNILNDLVLYLPHGYEAQGPDHSSARLERFLNQCVDENIIIANCTTPANLFHLLRRHKLHNIRKPLIIFTPKSLLRHPKCVSSRKELLKGNFKKLIEDDIEPENVKKVILCSGKIYYDLLEERQKRGINNTAIIRVEQLYPFPHLLFNGLVKKYDKASQWLWVQEEPENMGALNFIKNEITNITFQFISRPASASPASGSKKLSMLQLKKIMEKAFIN